MHGATKREWGKGGVGRMHPWGRAGGSKVWGHSSWGTGVLGSGCWGRGGTNQRPRRGGLLVGILRGGGPDRHPVPSVMVSCWRCGQGGQKTRRQRLAIRCRSESAGQCVQVPVRPGWDTEPQTTGTRSLWPVNAVLLASDSEESVRWGLVSHTTGRDSIPCSGGKNTTHTPKNPMDDISQGSDPGGQCSFWPAARPAPGAAPGSKAPA